MSEKHRNKGKKPNEPELERRSFLSKLWIGLGFIALAEIVWLVASYLSEGGIAPGQISVTARITVSFELK